MSTLAVEDPLKSHPFSAFLQGMTARFLSLLTAESEEEEEDEPMASCMSEMTCETSSSNEGGGVAALSPPQLRSSPQKPSSHSPPPKGFCCSWRPPPPWIWNCPFSEVFQQWRQRRRGRRLQWRTTFPSWTGSRHSWHLNKMGSSSSSASGGAPLIRMEASSEEENRGTSGPGSSQERHRSKTRALSLTRISCSGSLV